MGVLDRWSHGSILGAVSGWKQNCIDQNLFTGVTSLFEVLTSTTASIRAAQNEVVKERYHGGLTRLVLLVAKLGQILLSHAFANWTRTTKRGGRIDVVTTRWNQEDAELKAHLDAAELWRRERKEKVRYGVEKALMGKVKIFERAAAFMPCSSCMAAEMPSIPFVP